MFSFGGAQRKYFNTGIFGPHTAASSAVASTFGFRNYSTEKVPVPESSESASHKGAQALYDRAIRQEMGPIATARKVHRYKGNFKYLAGVAAVFLGIYYYSIWKVGQDDFSDVDPQGNVRERV